MPPYHLHWRGQANGTQTGFHIYDSMGEHQYGVIAWQDGHILVRHNDGSLFRDCGSSHGTSFAAASDLIAYHQAAEAALDAEEDRLRTREDLGEH